MTVGFHRRKTRCAGVLTAFALSTAIACGGDDAASGSAGETGDAGDSGDGGDDGGTGGDEATSTAVLHRLTEDQLNNTIKDLFLTNQVQSIELPPDIPVQGFENQAITREVSPFVVESLQRDLQNVTAFALDNPGSWLDCTNDGGTDPTACGHSTLLRMSRRAFRRELSAQEDAWILGLFDGWLGQHGFRTAMEMSLLVLLQSPEFLYQVERGDLSRADGPTIPLNDWEVASRLSYFLWDTMPDPTLFAAAAAGQLRTTDQIRAQAERMLADPRAERAILSFHRQWLGYKDIEDVDIDETVFESEDEEAIGGDLTTFRLSLFGEFDEFIRETVIKTGTLSALLTSRQTWASQMTAQIYGATLDESVSKTIDIFPGIDAITVDIYPATLPEDQRAGFFTGLPFLASHAHPLNPSPVLRGVFIRERLLCQPPGNPPDDVPPIEEAEGIEINTNRDKYYQHTQNPACIICHEAIDGTGFPFESYDQMGRFRTMDNGFPVDSSGNLLGTDVDGSVTDAIDLIERLAISRTAHDCMVRQWYRYAMHRLDTGDDTPAVGPLQEQFWADGGDIKKLLVNIASSNAFLTRTELEQ